MRQREGHSGFYGGECAHPVWRRGRPTAFLRPRNRLRLLRMSAKVIHIRVFAAPDASCGHGMTWSAATAFVGERLQRRFGHSVEIEHIEMFSPRSFEFPEVMAAIEAGGQLPVVMVGDRIVSQGGKLSERIIGQAVEGELTAERKT